MATYPHETVLALIARILAGEADFEEKERLNNWINSSTENKQYFDQIRNLWDASDKKIDTGEINTWKALENVTRRIPVTISKRSFLSYLQKVAAFILLPLAVGTLLWTSLGRKTEISTNEVVYNNVFTSYGTRTSLLLGDSTLVWLNSGSSLRYPNKFSIKNRTVFLNGEAYFKVKSDPSRPFIVETVSLQVKALGTEFNVREYDADTITELTLVSGKIFVSTSADEEYPRHLAELHPNQYLCYSRKTNEISISEEDTYRFIAWKDGKLIFRNDPLYKVAEKLSIMFNVDIELKGKELQDYRYRATFQDESLEEILKLLKLSSPIDFTEPTRNQLPDGSFPRKKVIIFPVKADNIKNPN